MPMPSQFIPLLGVASPGYTAPPLRTITINATRDGQQTSDYKEAVMWASFYERSPLVVFLFRDGITASRTFTAAAVDGNKALMIYDFHAEPYSTIRSAKITADIVLNVDLNDGTGDGGGPAGEPATVSVVVRVDKQPAAREIVAIEKTSTGVWRIAGNETLQNDLLEMQVTAGGKVFAVGLDDYGIAFQSYLNIELDQVIRPSDFKGWLYRCTVMGVLPATEPQWWTEEGENLPRLVGTARLQAVRYYQPIAHGPINYELI